MATNESREDLEKQLADLAAIAPNQNFGMDTRVPMGIVLLGRAILRLDETSSHLARVNIALTIVMASAAISGYLADAPPQLTRSLMPLLSLSRARYRLSLMGREAPFPAPYRCSRAGAESREKLSR